MYGWFNVNASGDFNKFYAYDSVDCWSGVFYFVVFDLFNIIDVFIDVGCFGVCVLVLFLLLFSSRYFAYSSRVGDFVLFFGVAFYVVSVFFCFDGVIKLLNDVDEYLLDVVLCVFVVFNVDC